MRTVTRGRRCINIRVGYTDVGLQPGGQLREARFITARRAADRCAIRGLLDGSPSASAGTGIIYAWHRNVMLATEVWLTTSEDKAILVGNGHTWRSWARDGVRWTWHRCGRDAVCVSGCA
jgi:hypothetical protein